jgi:hypothetical protein
MTTTAMMATVVMMVVMTATVAAATMTATNASMVSNKQRWQSCRAGALPVELRVRSKSWPRKAAVLVPDEELDSDLS